VYRRLLRNAARLGHKIRKFTHILSFCFVQNWDSSAYKFSQFVHKIHHMGVLLLQVTGTAHNVVGLVNNTSESTRLRCSQVRRRRQRRHLCDASVRLVGTTNPQQIEVTEFALIVAKIGDCSRRHYLLPATAITVVVFGDYIYSSLCTRL